MHVCTTHLRYAWRQWAVGAAPLPCAACASSCSCHTFQDTQRDVFANPSAYRSRGSNDKSWSSGCLIPSWRCSFTAWLQCQGVPHEPACSGAAQRTAWLSVCQPISQSANIVCLPRNHTRPSHRVMAVTLPGLCHCISLKHQEIWAKISANLQMNPKEVSVAGNRLNQTCLWHKMPQQWGGARLGEAQGSIKYFLLCSEDLLSHRGSATGIIVGTILTFCLQSYCPVLTKKGLSCLIRGEQISWQRRGSRCQSEGTEHLPHSYVCPWVTSRTYVISSAEAPEPTKNQ